MVHHLYPQPSLTLQLYICVAPLQSLFLVSSETSQVNSALFASLLLRQCQIPTDNCHHPTSRCLAACCLTVSVCAVSLLLCPVSLCPFSLSHCLPVHFLPVHFLPVDRPRHTASSWAPRHASPRAPYLTHLIPRVRWQAAVQMAGSSAQLHTVCCLLFSHLSRRISKAHNSFEPSVSLKASTCSTQ